MTRAFLAGAVLLASGALAGAASDDWPQWRGPGGSGVLPDAGFPVEWSPTRNIAWKTAIPGRGHSSPVIAGARIFLTTSVQGEQVPGRKAPDHVGFDGKPGYVHPDSVGVDYRNRLDVIAIDAATGRVLWERTAYDGLMHDDRHRKNTYASSTIATDGRLLYAYFEAAGLYCYDADGTLKWKAHIDDIAKAGMGPGTSPVSTATW